MRKRPVAVPELSPDQLCRRCDLRTLDFDTTAELPDFKGLLGQPRAVAAVEFGIGIEREGFNVFAFGAPGSGKHSAVREFLEDKSASKSVPPDLCYVNNFEQPHCPLLLQVPAGRGREFSQAMLVLVEDLSSVLETALESAEYQARKQALEQRFEERQAASLADLGEQAASSGLALVRTPAGIVFAPVKDESVLSPEEFQQLPQEQKTELEQKIEQFKEKLQKVLQQFPRWQRQAREELRELNLEVSRFAVHPLFDELRDQLADLEDVQTYLDAVEADVVDNAQRIISAADADSRSSLETLIGDHDSERPFLRRYRVNVIVDHSQTDGAPVIYEDNPTYHNLIGKVEHIAQMGAAVTDFNLIKPGALHRANGGYLLIDALKLLGHPYAYERLKRALESREVRIESLGEALSLLTTYSLEPEPAPLSVKVVLLGTANVYYLLAQADPEFTEHFKVAAEFSTDLEWTAENQQSYAQLIAKLAREEELLPFSRGAVCRLIEHSARNAGDSRKMSLLMSRMLDVMREADFWAARAEHPTVSAADVQTAIDAWIHRSDHLRERAQEQILRQSILVDTAGSVVGQVNALSVLQLGDFTFGRPSRITARVRLGKGEFIDIEREVDLSGPIHSKGVLILSGFLGSRYAAHQPLALSASLVFEQSYVGVDGDSASSTELYALLSAIADLPIRQELAVTGSVNQLGEIQAIGGVNEKIEGFFDICKARGLTGEQGVLIPAANTDNLMLRREVIEAVEAGDFHIYPVTTIDEGIALLTRVPAGEVEPDGTWTPDSVNARVAARLTQWAQTARQMSHPIGNHEAS